MVRSYTVPWMQNELGLTLLPARDGVFEGDIQGLESLIGQNELHVVTTTKKYPLGSMLVDPSVDAIYRYVEYGGTTKAGDVIQAEAPDGAHDDLDPTGTGTGAGVAKGETLISIADTITLVLNEYAGGFLAIEADTGVGYRYPIKSHTAPASNALITLWEPGLALAIDSTSDAKLVKSRYKEVIICPTSLTGLVVGVGLGVGADGSFGWMQTRGPASVLTAGTVVIGQNVVPLTTAGAVAPSASDVLPVIGTVMDVGPTTEQSLVFLTLE